MPHGQLIEPLFDRKWGLRQHRAPPIEQRAAVQARGLSVTACAPGLVAEALALSD
ncbi:MAG TPA: hypothetical protein VJG32_12115 [Anaerolineae bacterium]|nr:hypothetical protein [Anaerolineae bacterium]